MKQPASISSIKPDRLTVMARATVEPRLERAMNSGKRIYCTINCHQTWPPLAERGGHRCGTRDMVQFFVQNFDGYGVKLPRRRSPPRRNYLYAR